MSSIKKWFLGVLPFFLLVLMVGGSFVGFSQYSAKLTLPQTPPEELPEELPDEIEQALTTLQENSDEIQQAVDDALSALDTLYTTYDVNATYTGIYRPTDLASSEVDETVLFGIEDVLDESGSVIVYGYSTTEAQTFPERILMGTLETDQESPVLVGVAIDVSYDSATQTFTVGDEESFTLTFDVAQSPLAFAQSTTSTSSLPWDQDQEEDEDTSAWTGVRLTQTEIEEETAELIQSIIETFEESV